MSRRVKNQTQRKLSKPEKNNFQDKFAEREFDKGTKFEARKCLAGMDPKNDPQWYFKDRRILEDVASYAYEHPLGNYMDFPEQVLSTYNHAIPGLLAIEIGPVPGISLDAQSPVNLAAQDLYSFVRYKNSGASNYDPPDLMLYILAMDSLYSAWNWMKRIYGYASTYSQRNKYKPRGYAVAENVNLDDIYGHLADFRAYLNMAANRISAFAVPATMTYNVRHSWLFSNIYKDSATYKAQEYMYTPSYFYLYDENTKPKGGHLTPINVAYTAGTQAWTFATLRSMLDTMINSLQYSEDIGIMSGDIIKAYGSNLFKLSSVEPDYVVEAVFRQEILSQIENVQTIAKGTTPLANFDIAQNPNTNFILFNPTMKYNTGYDVDSHYLNFHWDSPSPEDVMVASRLNYTGTWDATNKVFTINTLGSEIAFRWFMVQMKAASPTSKALAPAIVAYQRQVGSTKAEVQAFLDCMWLWNSFDWAPQFEPFWGTEGSNTSAQCPPVRDYDVYTIVYEDNLKAMNELALLSEFNMPN